MKWSQSHIYTLKEAPADAEIVSHKLMIRAGLIKKLAPGLYSYGNLALRAVRKFEQIIREELDKRGCIEILMPVVHPREIWEETNRWEEMGDGLLKFKNRNDHWFCLAATHEEAVTDYVRHDLKSYRDLPKNFYQIQTKYRDEIRPRFGLMRGREFSMKDAYSFDMDQEGALRSYQSMYEAYRSIFSRLGLEFRIVQADAGNIGGSQTHEFQLLADSGEDSLLVSDVNDFAANVEICPAIDFDFKESVEPLKDLEKISTPGLKTIEDLSKSFSIDSQNLVKSIFFSANEGFDPKDKDLKAFCVLLRGSDDVNPIKVKNLLGLTNPPKMLLDSELYEVSGAHPGSCGPIGLKIPIYADHGVIKLKNYMVGANQDGFHFKNVNHDRDYKITQIADLRMAREGDRCPMSSQGRLKSYRGIEVGHVFYLGAKYSNKMKAFFLNKEGRSTPFEMGCYGIGVTRTVQAAIEQSHDKDGIIWPASIAPFHIHICLLDPKDEKIVSLVNQFELSFKQNGYDVFIDDRDERPGVKFKDADLLGMPVRLVVGKRGLENNEIEVVDRKTKEVFKVSPESLYERVVSILNQKMTS